MAAEERHCAPSRPAGVTTLAVGVLIIGSAGLVRGWLAVQQYEFLSTLLPVSPVYLLVNGLVQALAGTGTAAGLWFGMRWGRLGALIFAVLYTVYYWMDRLVLGADPPGANWLFAVGLNLVFLAWTAWVLTRTRSKHYFGEINE